LDKCIILLLDTKAKKNKKIIVRIPDAYIDAAKTSDDRLVFLHQASESKLLDSVIEAANN
jgi:hypothetical protein